MLSVKKNTYESINLISQSCKIEQALRNTDRFNAHSRDEIKRAANEAITVSVASSLKKLGDALTLANYYLDIPVDSQKWKDICNFLQSNESLSPDQKLLFAYMKTYE